MPIAPTSLKHRKPFHTLISNEAFLMSMKMSMSMRAIKVFSSQFNFFLVCWNRGAAPTVLLAALILSIIFVGNTGLQMCFFKRFFGVNYSFSSTVNISCSGRACGQNKKRCRLAMARFTKGHFAFTVSSHYCSLFKFHDF